MRLRWTSVAAEDFIKMYADELSKKYTHVQRDSSAETTQDEQIYQTSEGPVLIVSSGNEVFISESFDLNTARKLQLVMFGAQQQSGNQVAAMHTPPATDLSGSMIRFMAGCGMMKAALPHH